MPLTQVQGQMLSGSNNTTTTIQSNGTTAITINSSGSVLIGGTSTTPFAGTSGLGVTRATNPGIYISQTQNTGGYTAKDYVNYIATDGSLAWYDTTVGLDRMRIDSSGNVGVGTSSPSIYGKLVCVGGNIGAVPNANQTGVAVFSPASYTNYHYYANSSTAASTNWFHHLCYANNVAQFLVYGNGITQNAANSYGGISDIKLKENITVAGSQWNDVKALSKVVKKYQFINDPEKKVQLGFVAQDVQEISAGLIVHNPDIDSEGNKTGTETLGVAYSVAYMKAFKALGEALERIEKLEAEVAELKAKGQ